MKRVGQFSVEQANLTKVSEIIFNTYRDPRFRMTMVSRWQYLSLVRRPGQGAAIPIVFGGDVRPEH